MEMGLSIKNRDELEVSGKLVFTSAEVGIAYILRQDTNSPVPLVNSLSVEKKVSSVSGSGGVA